MLGTPNEPGVTPLLMKELYETLLKESSDVDIAVSYLEIYNENVKIVASVVSFFMRLILGARPAGAPKSTEGVAAARGRCHSDGERSQLASTGHGSTAHVHPAGGQPEAHPAPHRR